MATVKYIHNNRNDSTGINNVQYLFRSIELFLCGSDKIINLLEYGVSMRNKRQILWGNGQFLSPQHLQQQDLFHQGERQHLWKISNPYGWGVIELKLRQSYQINQFAIEYVEMLTEDGFLILAGSDTDNEINTQIVPSKFNKINPSQKSLSVYLWLPKYNYHQDNLSSKQEEIELKQKKRFRPYIKEECKDLFVSESDAAEVSYVEYNLNILYENDDEFKYIEESGDFILKIAELIPGNDAESMEQSKDYIFPCLTISASKILKKILIDIKDFLIIKYNLLSEIKTNKSMLNSLSRLQHIDKMMAYQTLSRYIPALESMLENGRAHPEQAYELLRQLVGELSVFTEEFTVLGGIEDKPNSNLKAYDHNNIRAIFNTAIELVKKMVDTIPITSRNIIPLNYITNEGYYQAKLSPDILDLKQVKFYLAIVSKISGSELWNKLQTTGKISAVEEMTILKTNALIGLKINYLKNAPAELPKSKFNYTYFSIDTLSLHWKRISEQKNITVFCDLDPNDTKIDLLIASDD